ncbi:MAG: glycosyltransferase family 4 protein [Abditibacteriota bacterium]|nr:glycosyltransferase family 4 protein [Abditibacteriota bacterium]
MGKKTVWLMNHYASNMFRDKAGRHYWFAKQLRERGHDAAVFCSTALVSGEGYIDTGKEISAIKETDGIPFVFVKTVPARGNGVRRVLNMLLFYKNLFPAAKAYAEEHGKPDVIVASSVHPLTMAAGIKIARKMKIPCICEIRDLWPEAIFSFGKSSEKSLFGRLLIRGEHWIYKNADALIFTKEGDTDYLKERRWTTAQGGDIALEKCHYINNGVDIAACEERIRTMRLDDPDLGGGFNVTYVGTIRPVNNVGNLLDAAKLIKAEGCYGNVRFLIYGDGSQLPALRERVAAEGLDSVKIKGFVNRQYVPYILSKSSVNVLNYAQNQYNWTRGNSSNKLFEYMASGKPVISTVRMGYSIIKRYDCGVELGEDTPEALAQEIMRFHDMGPEERDRLGRNAAEGAKDFDFGALTDRLLKVIESVV